VRNGSFPLSFGERLSWTVLQPIEPGDKDPDEICQSAEVAIRSFLGQEIRDDYRINL
jgi:1-acyl-sn-glycerol-3-phosphate acyltransferase